MDKPLLAAIEGGGTKFLCAVGRPGISIASMEIPTRDPHSTMANIRAFFERMAGTHGKVAAAGIASFGPLDLDPSSPDYGRVRDTPKPGWAGFDLLGAMRDIFACPVALETDVNAAALAEARIGAARNCDPIAYVTVGTGIGVGIVAGGKPVHGLGHPEGGHIWPRKHPLHRSFAGICPYHGDCLEGLASGPALAAAWGKAANDLPPDHPAWPVEADYLGQLCATLALLLAPQRIVLGGGVMDRKDLYQPIRARAMHWLKGYVPKLHDDPAAIDSLIVEPGCDQPSGLAGAYLLAEERA